MMKNIYIFPTIRFGISGNVVYIYAIQNDKNNDINLMSKRIKRKMYKVNESTNDLKQNLLDITSSFVIAGDLFIWLMEKLGYKKFSVVGYLPIRWNAKKINNIKKDINGLTQEEQHMFYNATEKFMNTFKRISYHNADLCSYHIFTGLMVDIVSETEQTNNKLLSEMISLSKRYKSD